MKRNSGFTLIEVIVVAAIIAILAGILVPMIFSQIDESKKTKALADCKSISAAILALKKDTGSWPGKTAPGCTYTATALEGGTAPALGAGIGGWDYTSTVDLSQYLLNNSHAACYPNWKGPYMERVAADPWGRGYVINIDALNAIPPDVKSNYAVFVMSSGGGDTIVTDAQDSFNAAPVAPNIGVRIK